MVRHVTASTIERLAGQLHQSANGVAAAPARSLGHRLAAAWRAAQPVLLATSGLSCFDVAAFLHSPIAGFLTTGASLLVLEWRLKG